MNDFINALIALAALGIVGYLAMMAIEMIGRDIVEPAEPDPRPELHIKRLDGGTIVITDDRSEFFAVSPSSVHAELTARAMVDAYNARLAA